MLGKGEKCGGDFFRGGDDFIKNRRGERLQSIQVLQVVYVVHQKCNVDGVAGGQELQKMK
jgi:hypothetical protein